MTMVVLPTAEQDTALSTPDGGFSLDLTTGQSVTSGYAVSIYPEREHSIRADLVTYRDVLDFALDNLDLLGEPGNVYGGWHDPESGVVYLDVSIVVDDLESALTLARSHGQRAVFDFQTLSSIPA